MHKIFRIEESILYSRRNLYLGESNRFLIHPIYIYIAKGRAETIVHRAKKEKEKEWNRRRGGWKIAHLHRMHGVHPTPRVRLLSPFVERAAATGARLPLSHFYSFSTLFLDYGLSAAPFVIAYFYPRPASRPAVIYFGTEIRFANHRATHCVPRRKTAFSL